jgi:hypothetical protein
MATAIQGNPQLFADDQVIYGRCTSVATPITKGDWVQFSGGFIVGLNKDAAPAYLLSGVGIALDNHPTYDPLGRSMENTAMPVLTHGVIRVTGGSAASLTGAPTLGNSVYPVTTASGIVGTTGATGIGGLWFTAAKVSLSAAGATGALASGVGKLINIAKVGDITASQWDIMFDARMLGVWAY